MRVCMRAWFARNFLSASTVSRILFTCSVVVWWCGGVVVWWCVRVWWCGGMVVCTDTDIILVK